MRKENNPSFQSPHKRGSFLEKKKKWGGTGDEPVPAPPMLFFFNAMKKGGKGGTKGGKGVQGNFQFGTSSSGNRRRGNWGGKEILRANLNLNFFTRARRTLIAT